MIFPFLDNVDKSQGQKPGKLRARFVAAIEEAFLAERDFFELGSHSTQGPTDSYSADVVPGSSHGQEGSSNGGNGTCKGCGRTISFTKNRKSESDQHLCITCSKLYKERCYCGVCERVWYDTDGGSFTQCDGCDIWVHTECIKTYTERFDYNFNTDKSDESGVKCLCQAPNCQDTWRDSFNASTISLSFA